MGTLQVVNIDLWRSLLRRLVLYGFRNYAGTSARPLDSSAQIEDLTSMSILFRVGTRATGYFLAVPPPHQHPAIMKATPKFYSVCSAVSASLVSSPL